MPTIGPQRVAAPHRDPSRIFSRSSVSRQSSTDAAAMRFRTWAPNGDGTYSSREVPGPSNLVQWEAAWDCFAVAMIMLEAAPIAALTVYKDKVRQLTQLWPDCWHLVALADDKMRAESWERGRRSLTRAIAEGLPAPPGYTPAKPWAVAGTPVGQSTAALNILR